MAVVSDTLILSTTHHSAVGWSVMKCTLLTGKVALPVTFAKDVVESVNICEYYSVESTYPSTVIAAAGPPKPTFGSHPIIWASMK